MSNSTIREVTGAEAGLSGDDQITIALREIVRRGGEAQMWEIYEAVEEELGGCLLSYQGKATLRRLVNTNAVEACYLSPHDPENPGWRITPEGRRFLESCSGESQEQVNVETGSEEDVAVPSTEGLEVNYDRQGNPRSVVLPYADYKELAAAKEKNEALRRKLRKIVEMASGAVEIQEPAPDVATEEDEVADEDEASYWLTPVKSMPEESAEECVEKLVGREKMYAFGERTPGRKRIKPGDWICFYASGGVGVIAHAQLASYPKEEPHPAVRRSERYPWVFDLKRPKLYVENPTVVDADLRAELDAFEGREPSAHWGWFVQATRSISRHDFLVLTQRLDE